MTVRRKRYSKPLFGRAMSVVTSLALVTIFLLPATGCSWLSEFVFLNVDQAIHKKNRENESDADRAARWEHEFYNGLDRERRLEELKRRYPASEPNDLLYEETF